MDSKLWNELIRKNFHFLLKKDHYKITSDKYFPEHFGNRITTLESDLFCIELLVDRSFLEISINPLDIPVYKESIVTIIGFLNQISGREVRENFGDLENQINMLAKLLNLNYQKIIHIMNSKNYMNYKDQIDNHVNKNIPKSILKKFNKAERNIAKNSNNNV